MFCGISFPQFRFYIYTPLIIKFIYIYTVLQIIILYKSLLVWNMYCMLANNAETFELHIPIPQDTRIHKVFKFLT